MPRTTPAQVRTVVRVGAGVDLAPYIETASLLVTAECTAYDPPYPDERLELIERWLAAHCAALEYPRAVSEGVTGEGGVTQTRLSPRLDLRLNNTVYGQMAMTLDTGGNLAALNNELGVVKKPLRTGVRSVWLGTPPC